MRLSECIHITIYHNDGSDEGLTLETSAFYPLRWLIYIFNSVLNTKLPAIHNTSLVERF